jgi:uncharacterized protein YndB with AHSA1/START domain
VTSVSFYAIISLKLELIEQDGHTVVRTTVDYPSKELREEIIATGMLDGWAESYDRLEEYLHNVH